MSNFKSQENAFNLLYWIKCNNTDLFLTNKQETKTKSSIIEENLTYVKEEALEILDEDIANSFVAQLDHVTSISNDDTLSKNEFIQDDFNEEIFETSSKNEILQDEDFNEENGRNSALGLDPLDSENAETCRPKKKKKFKCSQCQKIFTRPRLLEHINSVHRGLKPYKCNTCPKYFSLQPNLKRHIDAVHKGRKDFKCDSCGKHFLTKAI